MNNKSHAMKEPKHTRTPKVRFPDFRDAEGWKETELLNIAQPVSERAINGDGDIVLSLSGEHGIVLQSDYFGKKVAGDNAERYTKIARNDFVYNDRTTRQSIYGTIKRLSKYEGGLVSPIYKCFRFNNEENPVFWEWYFESGVHEAELGGLVNEGARAGRFNISIDKFLSTNVCRPNIPEQQKLAECLTSLDELITAHGQKLDALKNHKNGLMQQLFPLEGETLPRLRFPEFQVAPGWATRELGEFITERNQYSKESVPLFSLTIEDGVTPKTERYERSFLVNDEADAYKLVLPDDFAFNPMNLRFGAIGRHCGTTNGAVSKYYNIFSCDNTVDARFCEIYFKSEGMVAYYDNMAIGSLLEKRRVHFSAFLKFNIRFPQLPEQQKLADCLSSLDELIASQSQKLDALKTHKRGLMQQVFPSTAEVES
jgi:type I restriction enzyme, S subunit